MPSSKSFQLREPAAPRLSGITQSQEKQRSAALAYQNPKQPL